MKTEVVFEVIKLVRDLVPEIPRPAPKGCTVEFVEASAESLPNLLGEKGVEEAGELLAALKITDPQQRREAIKEELADVLQVVQSICIEEKIGLSEINKVRSDKKDKKGAFAKRIVMILRRREE